MRRRGAILCVLAAFALLSASGARAQSAFARDGLGEWLEGYDLRGQGLGNTGIGVVDPYNFTLANPASSAFAHSTVGYVGLEGSVTQLDDGNGTVLRHASRAAAAEPGDLHDRRRDRNRLRRRGERAPRGRGAGSPRSHRGFLLA
jgi:hypothetical protein